MMKNHPFIEETPSPVEFICEGTDADLLLREFLNIRFMKSFKIAALAAACATGLFFCACNDDNDTKKPLTIADLNGSYTGTFDFTPSPSDINPDPSVEKGIPVTFEVKNGSVFFPEFPAATLIKALVGEEAGEQLAATIGKITYEAPIVDAESDQRQLAAKLETPKLRIDVGGALVVLISIDSPGRLTYTNEGALRFTLRTTECQLGEGEAAGDPFDLVNELVFDVTKQ